MTPETKVITIDTHMHGSSQGTAAYYLPGQRPALIETGPATSLEHVLGGLTQARAERLDFIVVTHVHLDHAGAAGHLAREFPDAKVLVREEGARHMIDPSRLWSSASRLYPDIAPMFGEMLPIAESRVVSIAKDGPVADLGDRVLHAIYTPGHASHHMALYDPDAGDLFTGDALGLYVPAAPRIRPATPPPEFDLDLSIESMEKMRSLGATRLFPTHFGPTPSSDAIFEEAIETYRVWARFATEVFDKGADVDGVEDALKEAQKSLAGDLSPEALKVLEQTMSYRLNALGFHRWLSKKS